MSPPPTVRRLAIRYGLAVLLAAGGGLGAAVAAAAVPKNQRTHPHVSPRVGGKQSTFALSFTLRVTPGHQGLMETEYRAEVALPADAPGSCRASQPPPVTSGKR